MSRSNLEQPCIEYLSPTLNITKGEYLPNLYEPVIELLCVRKGWNYRVLSTFETHFLPYPTTEIENLYVPTALSNALLAHSGKIINEIASNTNINMVACTFGKKYGSLPLTVLRDQILIPGGFEPIGALAQIPKERQKRIMCMGYPIREGVYSQQNLPRRNWFITIGKILLGGRG